MTVAKQENLFVRLLANPEGSGIHRRSRIRPGNAAAYRVDNRPAVYRTRLLSEFTRGEIAEIILRKMPDRVLAKWMGVSMAAISRIRRRALKNPDEFNLMFNLHIPHLVDRSCSGLMGMLSPGLSMVPEEFGWGWLCDERG